MENHNRQLLPEHPAEGFLDIKGGITIDNVTVDLTIKDVTIKSGGAGASGWDLAGIYLKGHARLNLTLEGDNTLLGLEHGAGIEVEKGRHWLLRRIVPEA